MLAFEVRGGLEAGRAVQERVRIATLAVSLGDVRTLITHPASTTHASVGPDARRAAGIADGLVRYSAGLEDPQDLIEDLDQALGSGDTPPSSN
jgi:methionine-gamma-lyase